MLKGSRYPILIVKWFLPSDLMVNFITISLISPANVVRTNIKEIISVYHCVTRTKSDVANLLQVQSHPRHFSYGQNALSGFRISMSLYDSADHEGEGQNTGIFVAVPGGHVP